MMKSVSLALLFALFVPAFVGCGGGSNDPITPENPTPPATPDEIQVGTPGESKSAEQRKSIGK